MAQSTKPQLLTHFENEVIHIEQSPKWVRVVFGGQTIADSKRVLTLREKGRTPVYYFPKEDVRMEFTAPTDHTTHCPRKGDAIYWSLTVGGRTEENALWSYPKPHASDPDLTDSPDLRAYVAFYWHKMDAWFEEDEEVFVHARDPYKRVDVIPSSRHVRVLIGGETVAETRRPVLLFGTGMPTRYYIPKADVRMDLLVPSDRVTRCPYKGGARYYSVAAGDTEATDIVWYYRYPTAEATGMANHLAFFNERVGALMVDGEEQPKPKTRWSAGGS